MCLFMWLFLFHQSARSKDRLFGVISCFLCIWCPIFYSVVFCQFWQHLMIKRVIGRMCIPKCHWKMIVVNLVEQRWFLFVTLPGGLVLCVPGQYWVFPPLAAIIPGSHRSILATMGLKALYRDLRPLIQEGLAKLIKILKRIAHRADCSAQFIPKMFYGVTVGRSWRLLHLCDIALL